MAIKTAIPYLILGGKAHEAVAFYEKALGAKVQTLQRFGDAMGSDCPEAIKDWVMHAALELGDALIYLSDGSPEQPVTPGGTVNVAIDFDSEPQAHTAFDALSTGGTVGQPLFNAPWGGLFGYLQDRYGINWMFTTTQG